MIVDCHTHHADRLNAIVSVAPEDFHPQEGILYSVGIHPWTTDKPFDFELLETTAAHPSVVAIGETGIDRLRGADIDKQTQILRRHINLSERLQKPLILHVVKALDIILALRKECQPTMPWIWHGFRGNATTAKQLTDKGFYLSFGERFNAEAAAAVPAERLLLETDESPLTINEIAARIAACRHISSDELLASANL